MDFPSISDAETDVVHLQAELELGDSLLGATGSSAAPSSWLASISLRSDRSLVAENYEHIVLDDKGKLLSRSPWRHGDCLWAGHALLLPAASPAVDDVTVPVRASVVASSCGGSFVARIIEGIEDGLDVTVEPAAASAPYEPDSLPQATPTPREQLAGTLSRQMHIAYRSSDAVASAHRRALASSGASAGASAHTPWAFCGNGGEGNAPHTLQTKDGGYSTPAASPSAPESSSFSPHAHHDQHHHRRLLQSTSLPDPASLGRKWVELLLVNDYSRSRALGSRVLTSSAAIVQSTAALYASGPFGFNITVQLRAQVSLPFGDPWPRPGPCSTSGGNDACDPATEIDTSELLTSFSSWREEAMASGLVPAHDNAALFSHLDFGGAVVGLAHKPGMCSADRSATVNQVTHTLPFSAALLAHEMGHNFGLSHNEQLTCGATGRIMDGIVDYGRPAPTAWSNCSAVGMDTFFRGDPAGCSGGGCTTQAAYGTTTYPACLDAAATQVWTPAPECGNGVVEAGEDCDCGVRNCTVVDPCCDGALCRLLPSAQCSAHDACCDNATCTLLGAGQPVSCRPSEGPCDPAEWCLGDSRACPGDAHRPAGEQCPSAAVGGAAAVDSPSLYDGACFAGTCRSHAAQCRASEALFNLGALTDCSAFDDDNGDAACGELWCGSSGSCFKLTGLLYVSDGTPCRTDSQCQGGACVSSALLRAEQVGVYWHVGAWTQPAGPNGTQWRVVECRRKGSQQAEPDASCEQASTLTSLPVAGERPASQRDWPFAWQLSGWSACSVACGNGSRTRTAACVERDGGAAAADSRCALLPQPPLSEWCRTQSCDGGAGSTYDVGPWGECSARCGDHGTQQRAVVCRDASGAEAAAAACARNETVVEMVWVNSTVTVAGNATANGTVSANVTTVHSTLVPMNVTRPVPPPASEQPCNRFPCPVYATGTPGACSSTCGTGSAVRSVHCAQPDGSAALTHCTGPMPSTAVPCSTEACFRWQVGTWGECASVSRSRSVRCVDASGAEVEVRVDTCAEADRPAATESCTPPVISAARAAGRWGGVEVVAALAAWMAWAAMMLGLRHGSV